MGEARRRAIQGLGYTFRTPDAAECYQWRKQHPRKPHRKVQMKQSSGGMRRVRRSVAYLMGGLR